MKKGDILKICAALFMLADHIGCFFLGTLPYNLFMLLRGIGRLAFPMYAYSLVVGFGLTKNEVKYMLRLLALALISEIPYNLIYEKPFYPQSQNTVFILLFALLCLYVLKHIKSRPLAFSLCMFLICLGEVLKLDYGALGIVLVILIYYTKDIPPLMYIGSYLVLFFMGFSEGLFMMFFRGLGVIGIYLARALSGKSRFKYLFYIFYPVHLIVLYVLWRLSW